MNDTDRARIDRDDVDAVLNDETERDEPGTYFIAGFDGPCSHGDQIEEGDTIRADGDGGWEHESCADDDHDSWTLLTRSMLRP